jgi:cell division protein FtsB
LEEITKKGFISFMVPLALVMAIIIGFSVIIAKKRSELRDVEAKKAAIEREVARLKKKNLELHTLRDALVYDPVQIEKQAREQLGYGKQDEKTYSPKRNFRVVDYAAEEQAGVEEKAAGAEEDEGILRKLGFFGVFTLVIAVVIGVYYGTYWYEYRYGQGHGNRRVRS